MISKVYDVVPQPLADELLRLARLNRSWLQWEHTGKVVNGVFEYVGTVIEDGIVSKAIEARKVSGADVFGFYAVSVWLVDGPKVFKPTEQQCKALEQIEVRLHISEYSQPYPAVMVDLPSGLYAPFTSVLCHLDNGGSSPMLNCVLYSEGHLNDTVTNIAMGGCSMEMSLRRSKACLGALAELSCIARRVAVNSCLALANFGSHRSYLFPKTVERDRELAKERTERGERARQRLKLAVQEVALDREVVLHDREPGAGKSTGAGVGGEKCCHWCKGYWYRQPHGPGNGLRKLAYRKPVLKRADKLLADASELSTTYKG